MLDPAPPPPATTKTETDSSGYFNPPAVNPNAFPEAAPRVDCKGILSSPFI
jgi:hypothetical protein